MTISLAVPDILVARAQSGDLEALEALYRAFETPVYNLGLRVLRRPEDGEDVLQETFLEVVRSIKQYRGEGHLWGWIRQIATSKALMRIRHDRVRETEEFHEESAVGAGAKVGAGDVAGVGAMGWAGDRKSTRLNSSHGYISYAVFCLKKKKKTHKPAQSSNRRWTDEESTRV